MLFDKVVAFDHYRQKMILIVNITTDDIEAAYCSAESKLLELADILRNVRRSKNPAEGFSEK